MNEAISTGSAQSLLAHEEVLSRYFRMSNLAAFDVPTLIDLKNMFLNLPLQ
jgi:hypothetical protein